MTTAVTPTVSNTHPRYGRTLAYLNGDQSIPHNTATKLLLDSVTSFGTGGFPSPVSFDTHNAFRAATNDIQVPAWATECKVMGHISVPDNTVALATAGYFGGHLFRNGVSTPEAYYHNYQYYPLAIGKVLSLLMVTPWIPLRYQSEVWTLVMRQGTGQTISVGGSTDPVGIWLSVEYRA